MASLWSEVLEMHIDELREELKLLTKKDRDRVARLAGVYGKPGVYSDFLWNLKNNTKRVENVGIGQLKRVANALEGLTKQTTKEKEVDKVIA